MASAYPTSFRECMNGPVEIMGAAAEAAAWNGHHSESAPATRRRSFGPVSTIMQNLYAKMARAPPPPQGASGGLRVWLQRRAGDPLVPFRQSCRISMPRWRERRRRRRVIVQRTLTPSRLPSAALRSLARIRLGISVSYVIQRVHDSPVEIMDPAAEAAAWNGHHSESAPATRRISLPRWARAPPAQGDHAAHIDAFKAAIGCIEIIAKDPPWHQRILRHSESAR